MRHNEVTGLLISPVLCCAAKPRHVGGYFREVSRELKQMDLVEYFQQNCITGSCIFGCILEPDPPGGSKPQALLPRLSTEPALCLPSSRRPCFHSLSLSASYNVIQLSSILEQMFDCQRHTSVVAPGFGH